VGFFVPLTRLGVDLEYDWHQIRIVMAEMVHFIRQMQAYCQLEVMECSWKILTEFFHKREGDLDTMIDAHRSYLDRMVKKVFLLFPKAGKEVFEHFPSALQSFSSSGSQENLLTQVRDVFQVILQFREATVSTDLNVEVLSR
jgi:gamma-tubulin complex component 3